MKPVDINQILQSLSEGPAEGVSLMALARSTGKSLPELQKFLQTHRVCFSEMGQTRYKLNPNPPSYRLLESAQLNIKIQSANKRQQQILRWAAVLAAMLMAFTLLDGFA